MPYAIKLDTDKSVHLKDYDPDGSGHQTKEEGKHDLDALGEELSDLQEWLYAAQTHSVLIVLQGLDTSGKDGTIAHVCSHVNPQGCEVASFKVPTPTEAAHDFLWRVHAQAPARGMMTIFNRSHYEDVLVTRVHHTITEKTCRERFQHIRNWEKLLSDSQTIIFKFFLHISKDEQKARLLARENDPEKAWKLSTGDWEERAYWDDYVTAYEAALSHTACETAPWYVVPANHKWRRNTAIAETLVHTLRPYKEDWEKALHKLGQQRKAELATMRASEGKSAPTADAQPSKTH